MKNIKPKSKPRYKKYRYVGMDLFELNNIVLPE
jgi:hypothetical protein